MLEFVKDKNLNRRQLTLTQKTICAEKITKFTHGGDRKSEKINTSVDALISIQSAAKMLGVSATMIDKFRAVSTHGVPELIEAVASEEITINAGKNLSKLPASQQVTALADYRKKKETPQPRQPRIDKEEVKRKTAEWMEKNKTEFTEEDKRLNAMVDEIVIATTKSLQEISNFVPTMSSKANLYTILRRAIRAADKYTNDLESIEFNNRAKEGVE